MKAAIYMFIGLLMLLVVAAYAILCISGEADEEVEKAYQEYLKYKERQKHE